MVISARRTGHPATSIWHAHSARFTDPRAHIRTAPVRSQHVAPRGTLRNSRHTQRLMQLLPLPIPMPLKLSLQPAGTGAWLSSSSLLPLLLSTRGCRDSVWAPTVWLAARRNCRLSLSNRDKQDWFAYHSACLIFSWADGCSSLAVWSRDFSAPSGHNHAASAVRGNLTYLRSSYNHQMRLPFVTLDYRQKVGLH